MAKPKNTDAPTRITRKKTTAPRAARKRNVLAEDVALEIAAPPAPEPVPEPVVEPPAAAAEIVVEPIAVEPAPAPVPWTPPASEHERAPWLLLDGRRLVRAAARRLGRELARRVPLLGRVGGWMIGRLRAF